jgi:RHS repeat-associated protein
MSSSSDWLGNVENYTYDADGNLTSQANPNSTTTNAYDAAGNQSSTSSAVKQSCGGSENLLQSFGSSGTPSGSRNADGQLTQYGVSYSATCSGQTSLQRNYSYDITGQVLYQGLTTQGANPNTFAYDVASEPTTISTTVAGVLNTYTQTFDNAGEVTGQTHTSGTGGVSASFTYDSLGDQLSISSPATTFAYNAAGQMSSVTTPSGTTTYLYNGAGLASSATSPAVAPVWNSATDVNTSNAIKAVSCASATLCVGVGANGTAVTYNGTSWSSPANVDSSRTIVAVSCAPRSSLCVAVDGSGYETTYNGTSWSTPVDIDASRSLTAVSCPSSTVCVAVGSGGYAAVFTGTWSAAAKVDSTRSMTALSCAGSTFCVAVDGSGYETTYNGTSWSATKVDGTKGMTAVSCPTSSFCSAVDGSGNAVEYYFGTWSPATSVDGTRAIAAVSCSGTSFCIAVGASGYATTFNYNGGALPTDVDGSRSMTAVSCGSPTFCVAVDASGYQETYTGSWTSATDVDASRAIDSVSCPSTSLCVAADASGYVARDQGTPAVSEELTWDQTAGLPLILSDLVYDYVYGPSATPVEQINLSTSSPTFLTYTPESSTYVATNAAGDLVGFWGYDAYGNLSYGLPLSDFGYAGQYTDASSGLSNMRARFYQSQTGGFTTRDPAFNVTDIAYGYANGDPVNGSDPTGLCFTCLSTFIGAVTDVAKGALDASQFVTNLVISPVTALYHVGVDIYQNGANNCDGWRGFFTTKNIEDVGGFTALWTADALTVIGGVGAGSAANDLAPLTEISSNEADGGVYSLRDEEGKVVRTGRTSNLSARESSHFNDPVLGNYKLQVEYQTNVYAEQRGLEQALYDRYPEAQSANGGFNKIRAISLSNPNLPFYIESANQYLNSIGRGF